jgi:hypothetical protein
VIQTIRLLQLAGWVAAVVGAALVLKTWTDLRTEQRVHAFQRLPLTLNAPTGWKQVRLTAERAGEWKISLATVNAFSRPDTVEGSPFTGTLEVELLDAQNAVHWRRVMDGPSAGHNKPSNMTWTELAAIDLGQGREWTLRARVVRPDPAFDRTVSEIRAYPPQVHDMGWYSFGEAVKMFLWGLLGAAGLSMVAIARVRRRRVGARS